MRVLIVEDEEIVARRLVRLTSDILGPGARVERAGSLGDGNHRLEREPIDLLLLDLDLGGRDGFELLARATAGSFHTIVVSARHDRALEAFEHGVLDFVPKPYSRERLAQALARVERTEAPRPAPPRFLSVRVGSEVRPVPVDSIVFVQAAGDYSQLHCEDGSTALHAKTISRLEALLPEPFVRIHRSYLVRLDRVAAFESAPGSRYWLRLQGGTEIPVSRGRVPELRRRLGDGN